MNNPSERSLFRHSWEDAGKLERTGQFATIGGVTLMYGNLIYTAIAEGVQMTIADVHNNSESFSEMWHTAVPGAIGFLAGLAAFGVGTVIEAYTTARDREQA